MTPKRMSNGANAKGAPVEDRSVVTGRIRRSTVRGAFSNLGRGFLWWGEHARTDRDVAVLSALASIAVGLAVGLAIRNGWFW